MVLQQEALEYARECKRQCPQITDEELRAFLEAKFIRGVDPIAVASARGVALGCVRNPQDWLKGLLLIFRGGIRLWTFSGKDRCR